MMPTFTTNRSLLNLKFEGYKLSPLEREENHANYSLHYCPTQATVSTRTKTPLSFEEVQSRITHNHLAVGRDSNVALYISEDYKVMRIDINSESLEPTFHIVFELPEPLSSPESRNDLHKEYPSATFLYGNIWLVSDGNGQLYVLNIRSDSATTLGIYELQRMSGEDVSIPFKIHTAHMATSDRAVCILSYCHRESATQSRVAKYVPPQFHVVLVSVSPIGKSEAVQPFDVLWHGRGDDVPMYCRYDFGRNAFFLAGSSVYRQIGAITPHSYEPTKDEIASIPRAGEGDAITPTKPPPYSWTQTSDSVTVAFPLPSDISKSDIKVTITARTLTILIHTNTPSTVELPRYSLKQFWDDIAPSSSFWTWDKDAEHSFGLLTLHLDKRHEDTRWLHVFASAGMAVSLDDAVDVEVPETLDPSELWHIRESLEKYTSALRDGEDASGLGLGNGIPSLADGEMDEELDASVGRKAWVTWIGADGRTPSWAQGDDGLSTDLLATPMPGTTGEISLVTKNNVDGLLFTLAPELSSSWNHTFTYPALAFVLASKRDTRFTFHISTQAVLAFESGSVTGGGNIYIYRSPVGKAVWAKQAVLKISGGSAGALLGIGAVKRANAGYAVLCLCERKLVVLKDLV